MLTKQIDDLETLKAELLHKLNNGEGSPAELQEWSLELGELISRIDEKADRWLELSEIVNEG